MKQSTKLALVNQDVDTSFFTLESQWRGLRHPAMKRQVGRYVETSIEEIVQGKTINTFMDDAELRNFIHLSARSLLTRPELVKYYKRRTQTVMAKLRDLAVRHHGRTKSLNGRQLAEVLGQFDKLAVDGMICGTVVAFADIYGEIGNALTKIILKRKKLKHSFSTYTSVLGHPEQKSLTELAYEKIAAKRVADKNLLKELFWVEQGYIGRGLTKAQLQSIRKSYRQPKTPDRKALEQELDLTAKEKATFQIVRDIITIKSERADTRQFVYVVLNQILDQLAKQWKVRPEYLETLTIPEIRQILLKKKRLPEDLSQRWYHSVMIPKPGGYQILLGGKARAYMERHLLKLAVNENELKGQIAYAGKVKGRVKVIFGPQHNNKVKKGDILVATSTSPQVLPAMKQAAAFITDVGGITSHAAIVARELRTPCIVGTKFATQVLKDGDMIIVDANLGTIKKMVKS